MPLNAHEAGITVISGAVERYLKEVIAAVDPACAQLVEDIKDKRSTNIIVPISRDSSYEPSISPYIDGINEVQSATHFSAPNISAQRRYPLRQRSPRQPCTTAVSHHSIGSSSPTPTPSPIHTSILCPDTSWKHKSDSMPRVVVECANSQHLPDLERKVERYICEAGVNVVIGLIISQGKWRHEGDFEEGSCVLKIWTVMDDTEQEREWHLEENMVCIQTARQSHSFSLTLA